MKTARASTAQETTDGEIARASNARLSAIVESSDDAIVGKTLDGTVTSWNAAAEKLFGYTAAEMIGSSIVKIIPADHRGEEEEILAKLRRGIKIDHFETVRQRKDGSLVQVSITVSPVRDGAGRVVGASKIARDVSGRLELDRTRAMLAAIVASSDDAIVSKDLEGIVTSWNGAAERMYGYRPDEIVGRAVRLIIPPELQDEEDVILAKIRRGERIEHFETVRMRKDGSRIEVSLTISPIRDSSGRVIGASKIAREIGAQREAEREKDRFLAILAHELRNPLAPIRNAVQLLGDPGLPEEKRARMHELAERQVAHMARLLDDLLDVARISTGRVELKRRVIRLRTAMEHAVDSIRPMLAARRQQLETRYTAEDLCARADEVRVVQIVSNLLVNAIKYTDREGRIGLTLERDGEEAVIAVTDNGIGFTEHTRERLFRLFSQAQDVAARSEGGLGIGLALVREFVERHGGTVSAYSDGPNRGSRFTVRLPLLERA